MAVREMRIRDGILVLGVISLVLCAWAFAVHRNSRLASGFSIIHVGMGEKEVLTVLGRPSWVEPCGKTFRMRPRAGCTEYIYRNSFAPFTPEWWSVRFDNDKQVVDTFAYESP